MRRALLYGLIFLVGFVLFLPKERLWYTLEHRLAPQVELAGSPKDRVVSLEIEQGGVELQGMRVARFERMRLYPYLLLDIAVVDGLVLEPLGRKVERLYLLHSLLYPKAALVYAPGLGWGYMTDKKLLFHLQDEKLASMLKGFVKSEQEEGGVRIEYAFGH